MALSAVNDVPYHQFSRTDGRPMSLPEIVGMKLGYAWVEHTGERSLRRDVRLEWLCEMTGREILTTGAVAEGITAWNTLNDYELKALLVVIEAFPSEVIGWLKELEEMMKTATVTEVTFVQPYKVGTIVPKRLADAIEDALNPKKIVITEGELTIHLKVDDDLKKTQNRVEKKINDLMRNELRLSRGVLIKEQPCLEKEPPSA